MDDNRLIAWGAELRGVHIRLRRALEIARESIEDAAEPDSPTTDLLLYCSAFCTALTGHHQSENRALFPTVVRARPDLAPVIAKLVQDHSMLDHLIGALEQALRSPTSTEDKLRHLDGIEAVMETHFRYEEKQLIEVLDRVTDHTLDKKTLFGAIA